MSTDTLSSHYHAITPPDREATAAMRQAAAPSKGKIGGPVARPFFDAMLQQTPAAPGVTYEAATVGGVPGWWCRPGYGPADAAVLYLHGGAYVLGTALAFRNFGSQLAARVAVDFFLPDYRLAPENPFPAAVEDTLAAYRGLAALGRQRLALAGDSAGGGLALVALAEATRLAATAPAVPAPRGAAVLSPWTDLALTSASMTTRAEADPIFTPAMPLALSAGLYLNGHDARDPLASPVHGELAGLPPVHIHAGENEILLDDSRRYAARAQAAGTSAEMHIWEGMAHVFLSSVGQLEAAGQALDLTASFLRQRLA